MTRPGRLTAVARLTLWYMSLFTVATGAIVFGTYALVVREVESDPSPTLDPSSEVGARWSEALAVSDPGSLFEQAADDARQQVLADLLHRSVAVFVVGVAASSIGAWFLARRSLRPVGRIASLARGISGGNLDGRIALDGPDDELKDLADTFDSMLERLELAFQTQRAFAAQVSHELRTPLAVMRAEAELADPRSDPSNQERVLASAVLTQVDRADQLVGSLLALARADSGAALHDNVELGDLVGQVVGAHSDAADAAGVAIDLSLCTAPVTGDQVLLRALVANLVRNAINYNLPGGVVRVELTADAWQVALVVANTGRLLDPGEVTNLAEPFVRAPQDRHRVEGHGLGVAVVRAVVAAHHGVLRLEAREGGGLVATVSVPAREANADRRLLSGLRADAGGCRLDVPAGVTFDVDGGEDPVEPSG